MSRINVTVLAFAAATTLSAMASAQTQTETIPGLPSHYRLGHGGCRAGSGYSFVAAAPGYPSTYPKLVLRVFDGQIIGIVFEAEAQAGWRPWYDQPEGRPISHDGGPAHYSQTIYFKAPPSAAECAQSRSADKAPTKK